MIFFDFVPQLKLFAKRIINPNTSSVFTELSESKQKKTRFWVIRAWIVMLHFVFSSLSRICTQKQTNYTAKNMINTIFVIFEKSTLRTINNSHFHEDYVCGWDSMDNSYLKPL